MKNWYASKTLWVNAIAAIALLVQTRTGFVIDPEAQTGLLAVINIVLRAVTKDPLGWSAPDKGGETGSARAGLLLVLSPWLALALIAAVVLSLNGCATMQTESPQVTAGKSLLAVKGTIVTAATTTDRLCKLQQIPVYDCTKARAAYELAKPAYDAAVDAYLLMSTGGDPAAFGAAITRVRSIAESMLQLTGGAQ